MFRLSLQLFPRCFSVFKKLVIIGFVFAGILALFTILNDTERITLKEDVFNNQRLEIYNTIEDLKSKDDAISQAGLFTYQSSVCTLLGEGCTDNPDEAVNYQDKSIFGYIGKAMVMPYANPPASSVVWLQDSLEHAGFIPKTYAAEGIGFASIKGYINIWKLFRNFAYLLLVIIRVSIGFLIMFRVKLGGQTAITLQDALPRIVIALLLITFSFAIAGFIIDLMYVLISFSVSLIFKAGIDVFPFNNPEHLDKYQKMYLSADLGTLWPGTMPRGVEDSGFGGMHTSILGVGYAFYGFIPSFVHGLLYFILFLPLGKLYSSAMTFVTERITDSLSNIGALTFNLGHTPKWVDTALKIVLMSVLPFVPPGLIISFFIVLTILLLMFKIFFMLLTSYIKVIIYIIFAPIIIMFEAIPGNSSFSWWLKNLAGELASFPVVVLLHIVGTAIIALNVGVSESPIFQLPYLYGFQPADLNIFVGLGIILLTPDFIKKVKGWIGVEDSGLNFGLGMYFAGGTALLGQATGGMGSLAQWRHMLIGHDPTKASRGFLGGTGAGKVLGDTLDKFGIGR